MTAMVLLGGSVDVIVGGAEGDLVGVGVVFEEFGVAAPADGGVELGAGFVLAEVASEEVEEEAFAEGAVVGAFQRLADGADRRDAVARGGGEDLLGGLDVGGRERGAYLGERDLSMVDVGEAEQSAGVDEREQVVDLEREVVGEVGEVGGAAGGVQDLGEPGEAVNGRVREA